MGYYFGIEPGARIANLHIEQRLKPFAVLKFICSYFSTKVVFLQRQVKCSLVHARTRSVKDQRPFHLPQVLALSAGHFAHDLYTSLLAPWLPLIIRKLGLSLFQAGSLSVFLQIPSLLNPWLGSMVDRGGFARALVIVTPALTGTAMSFIGMAPSYGVVAVLLLTAGISVAALHVSAPVAMAEAAGARTGLGMSFHMLGGELARTIGPLLAAQIVTWYGLDGSWRVFPGGLVASALLWWQLDRMRSNTSKRKPAKLFQVWRRMRRVILVILGLVVARLFLTSTITTYLPTFLFSQGQSLWLSNIALSIFEIAAAAGVMTSGALSDKLGRKRIILWAAVASPPLMGLFLLVDGWLRMLVLLAMGAVSLSTTPVLMALMIESAGEDRAAANGTFTMMSFASRSLVVPAVGALADVIGLRGAYWICAGIGLVGIPFALMLPNDGKRVKKS